MACYAIGDVQGCLDPLRRLLDAIAFDPVADTLYFAGDLVNRGPQSLATLRFVHGLGNAAQGVLGNHDLYLIMQAAGFGKRNKEDTLDDIFAAADCDVLLDWLRTWPLCLRLEAAGAPALLVHAGLLPEWSVEDALAYSAEVSVALQAPDYREFLAQLWGSEPDTWQPALRGWERLRVIVNAMTRMRYVYTRGPRTGAMELRSPAAKGAPGQAPPDCLPWYAVAGRKSADSLLIVGHWSTLGLVAQENLLAIDTGCLWGGQLTAVRLEDRRIFQQPCDCFLTPTTSR